MRVFHPGVPALIAAEHLLQQLGVAGDDAAKAHLLVLQHLLLVVHVPHVHRQGQGGDPGAGPEQR